MFVFVNFRGICTRLWLQVKLLDWLLEDEGPHAALPTSSVRLGSVARPALSSLAEPKVCPPLACVESGSVATCGWLSSLVGESALPVLREWPVVISRVVGGWCVVGRGFIWDRDSEEHQPCNLWRACLPLHMYGGCSDGRGVVGSGPVA